MLFHRKRWLHGISILVGASPCGLLTARLLTRPALLTRPHLPPCRAMPCSQAGADVAGGAGRVIVFTSYRSGVGAIVEALRVHEPLISARWVP